jgi:hypothetical protein
MTSCPHVFARSGRERARDQCRARRRVRRTTARAGRGASDNPGRTRRPTRPGSARPPGTICCRGPRIDADRISSVSFVSQAFEFSEDSYFFGM